MAKANQKLDAAMGSRLDALELQVDALTEGNHTLSTVQLEMKQQIEALTGITSRLEESLVQRIEEIMQRSSIAKEKEPMTATEREDTPTPVGTSKGSLNFNQNTQRTGETAGYAGLKSHKLEFPRFNGEEPRKWIRKCNKYFLFNPMHDVEKLHMAALHMEGKADNWYLDYIEGNEAMGWETFMEKVLERFSTTGGENIIGQFNKLKQKGSVGEYIEQFEELKSFMLNMNRTLSEEYFIKSFMSGLKDEVGQMVDMLRPKSLDVAMHLARRQEGLIEAMHRKARVGSKVPFQHNKGNWKSEVGDAHAYKKSEHMGEKYPPIKRLTPEEIENRRKKGLCFNCEEVYHSGHRCKRLFVIIGEEVNEGKNMEEAVLEDDFEVEEEEGKVVLTPIKILARRIGKHNNAAATQVLVQWAHLPEAEATWEDHSVIHTQFPELFQ